MELLREVTRIQSEIPTDVGGGSSLEKVVLMARIAQIARVERFVEIGVYRGRSFLPVASCLKRQGGISYGIDPYSASHAAEVDVSPELKKAIDEWISQTDFDKIHGDVLESIRRNRLEGFAQIIREPSEEAVRHFASDGQSIGMLHIDGNHDTRVASADLNAYEPLLKAGGVLIIDDVDWASVEPVYERAKSTMTLLFEAATFAILVKEPCPWDVEAAGRELFILHEAVLSFARRNQKQPTPPAANSPSGPEQTAITTPYEYLQGEFDHLRRKYESRMDELRSLKERYRQLKIQEKVVRRALESEQKAKWYKRLFREGRQGKPGS